VSLRIAMERALDVLRLGGLFLNPCCGMRVTIGFFCAIFTVSWSRWPMLDTVSTAIPVISMASVNCDPVEQKHLKFRKCWIRNESKKQWQDIGQGNTNIRSLHISLVTPIPANEHTTPKAMAGADGRAIYKN